METLDIIELCIALAIIGLTALLVRIVYKIKKRADEHMRIINDYLDEMNG